VSAQLEYCEVCDTELRNDDPPTMCRECTKGQKFLSKAEQDKAPYVAVMRVPVFAESSDDARQKIAPYMHNMPVEASFEYDIEPANGFSKCHLDIEGLTLRVKLADKEKHYKRGMFSALHDYDIELVDGDGNAIKLPDKTISITISIVGGEASSANIEFLSP
jgi:hypothetical protein